MMMMMMEEGEGREVGLLSSVLISKPMEILPPIETSKCVVVVPKFSVKMSKKGSMNKTKDLNRSETKSNKGSSYGSIIDTKRITWSKSNDSIVRKDNEQKSFKYGKKPDMTSALTSNRSLIEHRKSNNKGPKDTDHEYTGVITSKDKMKLIQNRENVKALPTGNKPEAQSNTAPSMSMEEKIARRKIIYAKNLLMRKWIEFELTSSNAPMTHEALAV